MASQGKKALGGMLVAKATLRARVTVGKTLSPGNTISWTHLAGKCFEAGAHPTCRPVPGAPRGLGTQASALLLSALCVGKAQPSSRVMECGPERRNHILEILCRVVPQRKGPEGKPPVPRFVSKRTTSGCGGLFGEPSARRFAHIAGGGKQGPWEQGIQHGPWLCRFLLGEFGKPAFPLKVGLTLPMSLRIHRLVRVRHSTCLIMTAPARVVSTTLPHVRGGEVAAKGHRE